MGDDAHYFNIRWTVLVPTGRTTADVALALGELMARHEVLRTHFHDDPVTPMQELVMSGSLELPVHRAQPGQGEARAEEVAEELGSRLFRNEQEWALRCALVCEGDSPVAIAMAFSHLAVDLLALGEIDRDLRNLLSGVVQPPHDWQPLDQGRLESEPASVLRNAKSLDYWKRTLARHPVPTFPGPAGTVADPQKRFVRLRMDSEAVAVAASRIADRCQVTTSTVLLAAIAGVLAAYTGGDTARMLIISSNRQDQRSRRLVTVTLSNALFTLDTATGTFDEVVRRCFYASTNAYRFARYDPLQLEPVLQEARTPDGDSVVPTAFFNDARMTDRWDALPETDGSTGALRSLAAGTRVTFDGAWERQDAQFFVHTRQRPDRCWLYLMADTAFVDEPTMETLLRAIETVLVENAGPEEMRPT